MFSWLTKWRGSGRKIVRCGGRIYSRGHARMLLQQLDDLERNHEESLWLLEQLARKHGTAWVHLDVASMSHDRNAIFADDKRNEISPVLARLLKGGLVQYRDGGVSLDPETIAFVDAVIVGNCDSSGIRDDLPPELAALRNELSPARIEREYPLIRRGGGAGSKLLV